MPTRAADSAVVVAAGFAAAGSVVEAFEGAGSPAEVFVAPRSAAAIAEDLSVVARVGARPASDARAGVRLA
jgi:hypothetical protein